MGCVIMQRPASTDASYGLTIIQRHKYTGTKQRLETTIFSASDYKSFFGFRGKTMPNQLPAQKLTKNITAQKGGNLTTVHIRVKQINEEVDLQASVNVCRVC